MLRCVRTLGLLLLALAARAATLEYLSTDDMIARSTAIVRARVAGSDARMHGPLIYTHYSLRVTERLKGGTAAPDVVLPGGTLQGRRQSFSGVPSLEIGKEYLLFLWTGPSGLTQVIGLSQGVLSIEQEAGGELIASRPASAESMVEPGSGRLIADRSVRIRLSELRTRVAAGGVSR